MYTDIPSIATPLAGVLAWYIFSLACDNRNAEFRDTSYETTPRAAFSAIVATGRASDM